MVYQILKSQSFSFSKIVCLLKLNKKMLFYKYFKNYLLSWEKIETLFLLKSQVTVFFLKRILLILTFDAYHDIPTDK